jgi:Domain of unknown function (DUF4157)
MANMGKQKVSSKSVSNIGQKKSLFESGKFPQPIQTVTAATPTTDLSDYRQPQPGEMIVNVMGGLSSSQSVPARGGNMTPVNQLKPSSVLNSPAAKPVQKQEDASPNQTGLPGQLKAGIENLSGYSLDSVRVNYNSPKPAQLQALAYTQGTDIHVAPGQEQHLPHEAWHVVQQMQGRVKPTMQMKGVEINDDGGLEREADVMGTKAQAIGNRYDCKQTIESNSLIKSSISAQSPQQLKLDSSSTGDVIQRVVNTWGGSFSESNYDIKKERGNDGLLIGAYIKITFMPNANCPKNAKIGLIQIVNVVGAAENNGLQKNVLRSTERWAIDRQSDSNPVYGSIDPEKGPKSRELTDNPPTVSQESIGMWDDTVIDVGAQLGERRRRNEFTNAILTDDPRVYLNRGIEQSMHFETTAVVLEGRYKGLALGTVSWGWTKAVGERLPQLKNFASVNNSGSSENFEEAKTVWNKAAEEHELVPIPDIHDSNYRPRSSGCFLTTACVEYMGLSDDCEELTTLRKFRDTYLLSKSNGKELIKLYYEHSPKIVIAIHEQDNEEEILKDLYKIIRQCVDSIQKGDNEWAYQTYCRMVMQLKAKFIPEVKIPVISYL